MQRKRKKRKKKGPEREFRSFSVKLIVKILYQEIEVREIRFSDLVKAPNPTIAFRKINQEIKRKVSLDGYRLEYGYKFQYCLVAPLKPLIF